MDSKDDEERAMSQADADRPDERDAAVRAPHPDIPAIDVVDGELLPRPRGTSQGPRSTDS